MHEKTGKGQEQRRKNHLPGMQIPGNNKERDRKTEKWENSKVQMQGMRACIQRKANNQ